jgi:8-oxo-dGTP diphosphatase
MSNDLPACLPVLHVAAAVLRDPAGRVLLTQRPPDRDWPGRWEFPGGKVEPGEPVQAALARELAEELGIAIGATRPLIRVPWRQPQRRLLLDVHEVAGFDGQPHGREGQALQWCDAARLAQAAMPPADLPVRAALLQPALYAITPEPGDDDAAFLGAIDRLLAGGIRRLQLRLKSVDGRRRAQLAAAVAARTRLAGCELLVNGEAGLAEALGCGLHLGSAQLAASAVRPGAQPLAASCHSAADLQRAERLGCDFVVLGPVAATASHPGATPIGWEGFADRRAASWLPVYALGGLDATDLERARAHGAQGVAAITGLWPVA